MKLSVSRAPLESRILTLRGEKVILDLDLAEIYGVETKVLNQAVKRNADRFPKDFRWQLNQAEAIEVLRSRSQIVTLKRGQRPEKDFQVMKSPWKIGHSILINTKFQLGASGKT